MTTIGGFFPIKKESFKDSFFDSVGRDDWDLCFTMSGRCGIYHALNDLKTSDTVRLAYLPAYTCETVLAPYKKAGYQLAFYEVARDMTPVFDEQMLSRISVLSLCGYYGFCNYDRTFVKRCRDHGIVVIEDTTHSIFSADGIDENCDYIVGSLRKWLGVPAGGFAIKTGGPFTVPLLPAHRQHLDLRRSSMQLKENRSEAPADLTAATQIFWDAEMMLRTMFDAYASDRESTELMQSFDYPRLIHKRRENYQYLLDHLNAERSYTIVFPQLKKAAVPSHFTIYHPQRDMVRQYLNDKSIHATVYWPVNEDTDLSRYPEARFIYDHVLSLPCDQRYGPAEMERICSALNEMPRSF